MTAVSSSTRKPVGASAARSIGDGIAAGRAERLSGSSWAMRYRIILGASDAVVVITATLLGLIADPRVALWPIPLSWAGSAAALVVVWLAMLAVLHSRDRRVIGMGAPEYKRVANASLFSFGIIAVGCTVLEVPTARFFLLVSLPVGLLGLLGERWLWRKWLYRRQHDGCYLSRAIVVGEQADVEYVLATIAESGGPLYAVDGVAIDGDPSRGGIRLGDRIVPVVGTAADAAAAAARAGAEVVIVAGQPAGGSAYIRSLAWALEPLGAELVLSSQLADVAGPRIHLRPVAGLPLIHVETPRFEGSKHALKRGLDLLGSAAGLILLSPVFAAIAVAVKCSGSGPVLFRQRRIGRNGESFEMLKFRSMVPDAEARLAELRDRNEGEGLLFKLRDDPRVTPIGRILRAHSIDELPQLWNVLRGEMSLVGPRPPLPSEVAEYTSDLHRRLYLKPGLTGLWQVSGRSDLGWEQSVRLDLYYVENWSLTGDLMLIWRTLRLVLRPEGAY